jgi:hypothetical protein
MHVTEIANDELDIELRRLVIVCRNSALKRLPHRWHDMHVNESAACNENVELGEQVCPCIDHGL